MNRRGSIACFMVCKIGIVLAVVVLIGAVINMASSIDREAHREEMIETAKIILGALEEADSIPGKVSIERELPGSPRNMSIVLEGERGPSQLVRVRIEGLENIARHTVLSAIVNNGSFSLRVNNPSRLRLLKESFILMELI